MTGLAQHAQRGRSALSRPRRRLTQAAAGLVLIGASATWALWPASGIHTKPGRALSVDEMGATLGGFDRPKAKRIVCESCNPEMLGGQGQQRSGTASPGVEPSMGNVYDSIPGPSTSAVGGGVAVTFRYDSDLADGSNCALNLRMGYGWTHNHQASLIESGVNILWLKGDGRISHFRRVGPSTWIPMNDEFALLDKPSPGEYRLRSTDGATRIFDRPVTGPWPGVRWLLASNTDSNGRAVTYAYDGTNNLTSVTDHYGNALTFGYDGGGRLTSVTDPLGRATTLGYADSGRRLSAIFRPDGLRYEFEYNVLWQMTVKRLRGPCPDIKNRPCRGDFDLSGIVGLGDLRIVFDGMFSPRAEDRAVYTIREVLEVVSSWGPCNTPPEEVPLDTPQAVAAGPFPCDILEAYTLIWNQVTRRIVRILDMGGNTMYEPASPSSWSVNTSLSLSSGEMRYHPGTSTVTDALGHATKYTYDDRGRITQIERPLVGGQPAIITYEYDPGTLQTSKKTDPLGRITRYEYNSSGQMTKLTDPEGNITRYEYTHTIPDRRTKRTDPDGKIWEYQYDSNGNLTKEVDPLHGAGGPFTTYGYDGLGRRTSTTDRNGNSTAYQYDPQSRLIQTTRDPGGLNITTSYSYDAVGNRTSTTDPNGRTTTYEYDAVDRKTKETRDSTGLGLETRYEYDQRGHMTKTTDPRGNSTTYEYDDAGRLTKQTDRAGNDTTYEYDANGRRTKLTDPNGNETTYEYDARNRLTASTDDVGAGRVNRRVEYSYDAADNLTTTTRPVDPGDGSARVIEYTYDALDRKVTETRDPGGLSLTYTYEYAPAGGAGCGCSGTPGRSSLIHKITDPTGRVTYSYYDALDRRVSEVRKVTDTADNQGDADDAITRYTYDPVGNLIEQRVENDPHPDLVTTYSYDAADRRISETRDPGGAGLTTTTSYDPAGNVIQSTAPNGNVTTTTYDGVDRMISMSDSHGPIVVTTEYDGNGNVLRRTDGNTNGNTTHHAYDAMDRRVAEYDALDQPTTHTYDDNGNRLSITDRNGNTTTYQYDGVNRVIRETRADGSLNITTRTTYDDTGNVRTVTAENVNQSGTVNQTTQYEYDAANRRVKDIHPDVVDGNPSDVVYSYDGAGNTISRRDQNQDTTAYSYDHLHRPVTRTYTRDPGSPSYPSTQGSDSYTYDRAGQMLSSLRDEAAPTPDVLTTMSYDGVGRVTSHIQDGRPITYAYDVSPINNRRDVGYPSGRVVRYEYDGRDRLIRASDQPSNATISQMSYDPGDRQASASNGNGTTTAYTYDALNRTTRIVQGNPATYSELEYGYDAKGNPLFCRHHHSPNTSEWYRYDAADRLVDFKRGTLLPDNSDVSSYTSTPGAVQRQAWTLDRLGNWMVNDTIKGGVQTCEERFANEANEYTHFDGATPCPPSPGPGAGTNPVHDDNGNLILDPLAGPGATGLMYQYDCENRLTRAVRSSDGMEVGVYFYDGLGRRVRKVVSNSGALDGTTITVLNEVWQPCAEYDGSGVLIRERTYGWYLDEILTVDRNADGDGTTIGALDDRRWIGYTSRYDAAAVTDGFGAVIATTAYDPYGAAVSESGPADALPDRFTCRTADDETGEVHFRNRQHRSGIGRFTSRDPSGFSGSPFNLFEYVRARPTLLTDPLGLAGGAVAAGAAAAACPSGTKVFEGNLSYRYRAPTRANPMNEHTAVMDYKIEVPWDCRGDGCRQAHKGTAEVKESNVRWTLDKVGFSVLVVGVGTENFIKLSPEETSMECPRGKRGQKLEVTLKIEWIEKNSAGIVPGLGPLQLDIGLQKSWETTKASTTEKFIIDCCCDK